MITRDDILNIMLSPYNPIREQLAAVRKVEAGELADAIERLCESGEIAESTEKL